MEEIRQADREDTQESKPMTIETILTLVVVPAAGALVAAVTTMWRQSNKTQERVIHRLESEVDECETRAVEQHEWALEISERVGNLEGTVQAQAQSQEQLMDLCDRIVEKIGSSNI